MHQPKKVKTSLSRAGLSIRVFSLSLLLLGSMLTFISAVASSSQVFAQGSPKMSTHHLTSVRPHAIVSSQKDQQQKGNLVPTDTPTATSTATTTNTPTTNKPLLFLTNANTGGNVYNVGDPITFNLTVSNLPSAFAESQTITINDAIPTGLTNLIATGSEWSISLTSTTGPAELTATYVGTYPVAPGAVLPTIMLTGTLTDQAVPSFTTDATINSADDLNPSLNTSINTVFVSFGTGVPTATTSATAVPTTSATVEPTTGPIVHRVALGIEKLILNGDRFNVGDTVAYEIRVSNLSSSDPIVATDAISVSDIIPLGLINIRVNAPQWRGLSESSSSPTLLNLNYAGSYPIAPDQPLPSITVTGTLTAQAVPSFTTAAIVNVENNPNPSINTSIDTIFVSAVAASPTATASATPVSTTTVGTETATPPSIPNVSPALAVVETHLKGDHFKVGDRVTYIIVVENLSSGDPVVAPSAISVSDVLPLGLTDIKVDVDDSQWSYTSGDTNGPALLTVNYAGNYPVAPGQVLAPITITGKLTNDAVPYITNTATVDTAGNSTVNNSATDTVFVDVNNNDHCCNNNGCCTDQNGNNNNGNHGNNNHGNKNGNHGNNNNSDKNNQGDKNNGKGSQDPISGDPTSYNGSGNSASGDPTSYNGNGDSAGSGSLPHLPLTGGAPLAG